MAVEQYNQQVADALDRARQALRLRSGEAFARAMAQRVGGAPSGSTYRRWVQGQQQVPGWALLVAAEMTGQTIDALVGAAAPAETSGALSDQMADLRRQVEALQRQVADLQVEAMDRESAQPGVDKTQEISRRAARGA